MTSTTRGADPVRYFFEKAVEMDPQNKIPKLELLEHYQNFCREEGLATESDQSFSRKLSQYYNLQQGRTKVKGSKFTIGRVSRKSTGSGGRKRRSRCLMTMKVLRKHCNNRKTSISSRERTAGSNCVNSKAFSLLVLR